MNERNIPDVWKVFGSERNNVNRPVRRNSWQKFVTEEEKTITDLFSDIHLHAGSHNHAGSDYYDDDENQVVTNRKNSAKNQSKGTDWQSMEKHLSMKKTIRKKMMRDLKQAILDSESADCGSIQLVPVRSVKDPAEPNLLELLKNSETVETKPETVKKPGFWAKLTKRNKTSKR